MITLDVYSYKYHYLVTAITAKESYFELKPLEEGKRVQEAIAKDLGGHVVQKEVDAEVAHVQDLGQEHKRVAHVYIRAGQLSILEWDEKKCPRDNVRQIEQHEKRRYDDEYDCGATRVLQLLR